LIVKKEREDLFEMNSIRALLFLQCLMYCLYGVPVVKPLTAPPPLKLHKSVAMSRSPYPRLKLYSTKIPASRPVKPGIGGVLGEVMNLGMTGMMLMPLLGPVLAGTKDQIVGTPGKQSKDITPQIKHPRKG
jgi:hypothetical protein